MGLAGFGAHVAVKWRFMDPCSQVTKERGAWPAALTGQRRVSGSRIKVPGNTGYPLRMGAMGGSCWLLQGQQVRPCSPLRRSAVNMTWSRKRTPRSSRVSHAQGVVHQVWTPTTRAMSHPLERRSPWWQFIPRASTFLRSR